MHSSERKHEQARTSFWISAWLKTADTLWATKMADEALKDFDERFPAPVITED